MATTNRANEINTTAISLERALVGHMRMAMRSDITDDARTVAYRGMVRSESMLRETCVKAAQKVESDERRRAQCDRIIAKHRAELARR